MANTRRYALDTFNLIDGWDTSAFTPDQEAQMLESYIEVLIDEIESALDCEVYTMPNATASSVMQFYRGEWLNGDATSGEDSDIEDEVQRIITEVAQGERGRAYMPPMNEEVG